MQNHKTNLYALRRATAALAIVPGFYIGKLYMGWMTPSTNEAKLVGQMSLTMSLGYITAYILIGIVAAQFLEPKPRRK